MCSIACITAHSVTRLDFPFSERLSAIAAKTRSLADELDWIMEALGKPKMCKMDARYHE